MQRANKLFLTLTAICGATATLLAGTPKSLAENHTDSSSHQHQAGFQYNPRWDVDFEPTSNSAAEMRQMWNDSNSDMSQRQIDIEAIDEDTSEYLGQTVTLRGEVEEFITPNVITLEENDAILEIFNDDSTLVIMPEMPKVSSRDDQELMVTGQVRRLSMAEAEREYNFDFDDFAIREEIEIEYENRPVIYADYVEVVPES